MTINRAPIFLNCFSRGGSNIFWNLFLSHPDACSPILETAEIFSTRLLSPRIEGLKVVALTRQWDFFDNWNLNSRRPISERAQGYIDRTLAKWKLKTLSDQEMRFKYENAIYTEEEVTSCRLVTKNNNGLVFLSDIFHMMYPDATFFALVRDPVALYESHKRREITASPEVFASFYNSIARRMLEDAERWNRYHIVRFEDVLTDPFALVQRLYKQAELDFGKIDKLRLKAKPHWQPDGSHGTALKKGVHYWLAPDELDLLLERRINQFQASRINAVETESVRKLTASSRSRLGYG